MTPDDLRAILPLLILTGWACALLLVDVFLPRRWRSITAPLAALGVLATAVPVLSALGQEQAAFGGMIVVDGFASFLALVFLSGGLVGIVIAHGHLRRMGIERGEYYTLLLFSLAGMLLMGYAGDLIIVFLALELLSIPLYVLCGLAAPRLASEESALKYFLLGAFASGFVLYGIALVYGSTQTTNLTGILGAVRAGSEWPAGLLLGAGLILMGLGFKVAVVPFHMWTPDVYHGAPSSVVAFMSVGAKAGGFAALLRVFLSAFPGLAANWAPVVGAITGLTMIWGNVAAIAQSHIKRLLAYSSIAHAGYILLALAAAAEPGVAPQAASSALFYLAAYAVTGLGAWSVVLAVEKADGGGLKLEDYAGLGARRPGLALAMTAFMLSLTGIPPTIGFVAKFYLFRAAIDAGLIGLAIVGVLTSLVSAYYYLKVVVVMYMRAGEPEVHSDRWLSAAIGLAAAATVLLGILPGPLLSLAEQAHLLAVIP